MKVTKLPIKYNILPFTIPLIIPNFEYSYREGDSVFALSNLDSKNWYNEFINKIEIAISNKEFLPICRMSDGEFMFCVGEKLPSIRKGITYRLIFGLRRVVSKLIKGNNFRANTLPSVPSGNYTQKERRSLLPNYGKQIKAISQKGILAIDFTFGNNPFQEQYFPDFKEWMEQNNIQINSSNYYPFYFVYAALLGPMKFRLLKDKNILVIHSAVGKKREKIELELFSLGVKNIEWLTISEDRSLFDVIDLKQLKNIADICLIGAGVGKPNIILQLEPLKIPCIDAGYVFEVWHHKENMWKRRYCVQDHEYDTEKVSF